jgi:hypothetical protein
MRENYETGEFELVNCGCTNLHSLLHRQLVVSLHDRAECAYRKAQRQE